MDSRGQGLPRAAVDPCKRLCKVWVGHRYRSADGIRGPCAEFVLVVPPKTDTPCTLLGFGLNYAEYGSHGAKGSQTVSLGSAIGVENTNRIIFL